jgi:hypothetical protein
MINRISLCSLLPAMMCSLLVACVGDPDELTEDESAPDEVADEIGDEIGNDEATEAAALVANVPPSAIGAASFSPGCGTATATPVLGRVDLRFAGTRVALAAGTSRKSNVCQVKLTVNVPPGRVLSAQPVLFAGQAQLAAGIDATATVRFALGGSVAPARITAVGNGAFRAPAATGVTSRCGRPEVLKATITTVLARRSGNGTASLDLTASTMPGLSFVACP